MKKIALLFVAMLLTFSAFAQIQVKGTVVDETDLPVIGAGVIEVGKSANGSVTDLNGNFVITVPSTASLQVSCIGYVSRTVEVNGNANLKIILNSDTEKLDDVVVVAFGKMKKEAFTGSAGTMKSDELSKTQVSNAAQALAGRVAGVQINNTSGQLSGSPTITIRGIGSIYSSTSPLIVVDGMPYDGDLNLINSGDIESMTVLKDAASNALYGARGANGVIMITTKKGKAGEAKITVDAKWGVNTNALSLYNTTSTSQFYETYYKTIYNQMILDGKSAEEAHSYANNAVQDPSTGPGYMVYTVPTGQDFIQKGGIMNPAATLGALHKYGDTTLWIQPDSWEKEGLQAGARQEYNVTASGRIDKISLFSSIGYLKQQGIQENSDQNRLTARLSADYQAKSWLKIGANFSYTKYKYHNTSDGVLNAGYIWQNIKTEAPVYPVYLRDANKNIMVDQWGEKMYDFAQSYGLNRAGGTGGNAIFNNKYASSGYDGNSLTASGYADVKIFRDLTFTLNASAYSYDRKYTSVKSPFVDYYTSSSDNGTVYKTANKTYTYNTQQLLNYNKTVGKHEITALLGHEYYNYRYEYMSMSGKNFGIDNVTELGGVLNVNPDPYSSASDYNVEGYFFRGMYNYDGKYYASASFRRDASSRFKKEYRWGNFWSIGGAWMISKENFFSVPWINTLKFKASLGSQGNDSIGDYLYSDTYSIVNNNDKVAYQWRQKGTSNITWETNSNFNTGFEFDMFGGKLSGSIDYFYRKTSDMLFKISTPPTIGYDSYWANLGDMRNSGIEIDLHATVMDKKNFRWLVDFNISHVRDKILSLPTDLKTQEVDGHHGFINEDSSFISKYRYFMAEGLPLYSWYLNEYAGVNEDTGEALYYVNEKDAEGNPTGKRTTTTIATEADYYLCGNAMPDVYGGLGMTFQFYGFDLSFNLTYQLGGKAYDYAYQILMHNGSGGQIGTNWHKDILRAWTPENKITDVPRLNRTDVYTSARSSRFLVSASYLNFQNVNIGYTIPSKLTKKIGVESIRVYGSAENLFYISARKGFDPRYTLAGYGNMSSYNPIRTISGGISLTF